MLTILLFCNNDILHFIALNPNLQQIIDWRQESWQIQNPFLFSVRTKDRTGRQPKHEQQTDQRVVRKTFESPQKLERRNRPVVVFADIWIEAVEEFDGTTSIGLLWRLQIRRL